METSEGKQRLCRGQVKIPPDGVLSALTTENFSIIIDNHRDDLCVCSIHK